MRTQHTENVPMTTPEKTMWSKISCLTRRREQTQFETMNFTVNEMAKYYNARVRMSFSENIDNTYSTISYSPIYVVIRERCLDS